MVNDSVKVDNVTVFNVNGRKGAIIKDGFFEINARTKDTLVFSSMIFQTKKIILQANDFEKPFVVNLKTYTNQLKDVKVNNKKYSPIQGDTQKYVDQLYSDDAQSHIKNTTVYEGQTPGVNFVRLFKDVVKLFKKKNPKKLDYFADVSFTELVLSKIKYDYFTNTLKLKDEEVRLFLVFCENDEVSKDLSRYKTSFELMDFLFNKNKEFTVLKNNVK
ncbi:MAG: hypothetical protein H7174_04175 [Flavobacterium sp.]|nr:hypothetical protein [Flavobacterium sp.]